MNYPLYNESLCPRVWDLVNSTEYAMKPEVRKTLLAIALDFVKTNITKNKLKLPVKDIVLLGSLTNFNWTPHSDFDLHIVVDFSNLDTSETEAQLLVDGLKNSWNKSHNITIKGHPVELYVQDVSAEPHSMSSYSVKSGKWIKSPVKDKPKIDKEYIKKKHSTAKGRLDDLFREPSEKKLESELDRIYNMRQAGLDKKGEFSEENIVFKILRAQGYLDKLKDLVNRVYDRDHSLAETDKIDDGLYSDEHGKVVVTDDGPGAELVPTDDDNKNRVWKFHGYKIFGAYRIEPLSVKAMKGDGTSGKEISSDMTKLRHATKHPIDGDSQRAVEELITKSVDRLFKQMDMKSVHVLVPLGSNSKLNLWVADEIKKRIPDVVVLQDIVHKSTWKDVKLSDVWKREMTQSGPQVGTMRAEKILAISQRTRGDAEFQIKQVPRGLRRYFGAFYRARDGSDVDLNANLRGKTALVIDDTLEEGATMAEAIRVLSDFQPKEILGYIFLYGRNAGV